MTGERARSSSSGTSEGLRYEYRPRSKGGARFPGVGRRRVQLEIRPTQDGIRYRYRFTERGVALLVTLSRTFTAPTARSRG